ncbi:MAG: spermidine synthase [Caulobacteraceae bacterium]|nr:spermidine synthase [Caulobacteraceae bacterium]
MQGRPSGAAPFAVAAFLGAALVFTVEPMAAKLVLPMLGGSSAVWNTCLAFFQLALLAGYFYAHLLQRIGSAGRQAVIHLAVLVASALVLPLRISGMLGDPWPHAPSLWLMLTLTLSLGAPFAALSATAPLVQAWRAREGGGEGVWSLYVASNLGSLIALLAYPTLVEPNLTLAAQRWEWSGLYGLFVLAVAALGWRVRQTAPVVTPAGRSRISRLERLRWLGLAALPSSLMLGVTTYLTTDVASAPFLWVGPLALYLLSFVIAFQTRPMIPPRLALILQAATLLACAATYPFHVARLWMWLVLSVHLVGFFFTALVCHQALAARRPDPSRLTDFYLTLAAGGVVGGAFNAFVAPLIFSTIVEYPAALALAALTRPWRVESLNLKAWLVGLPAWVLAALACLALGLPNSHNLLAAQLLLAGAAFAALASMRHALVMLGAITVLTLAASTVGDRVEVIHTWRSFFGVLRTSHGAFHGLGELHMLAHGTTLHGAQSQDPRWRCRPLVYYGGETPIGQVFEQTRKDSPAAAFGVVGLGTGAVSAYTRPGDRMTFFEIDPLVLKVASDPANFTYLSQCARGRLDFVLGDARLTLAKQPPEKFDLLLIDAFSSDSVPAHLLTVEAIAGYLAHLKPDGVLILHLSNRNLDLTGPAQAAVAAAGGSGLIQVHIADPKLPKFWESDEVAVIAGRTPQALAPYAADPRWSRIDPAAARPWTDDYTNLFGALVARWREAEAANRAR